MRSSRLRRKSFVTQRTVRQTQAQWDSGHCGPRACSTLYHIERRVVAAGTIKHLAMFPTGPNGSGSAFASNRTLVLDHRLYISQVEQRR